MGDADDQPSETSARTRLPASIAARVGIDTRALATLRISLGLLLVLDLLLRARNLGAFYTDAGVLPRAVLFEQYPVASQASVHALSGDAWFQALLFAVAGACALSMLVGYRTRTATLLSLALLTSLFARNPLVLNGGDSILWRLLFWSLFLPLGERWSLDALRSAETPRRRVTSLASAALLLQVVVIYTVNGALKLRGTLWTRGEAVRYALSLQHFTLPLGDALSQFPTLLHAVDVAWLAMVLSSALLILLRGRARAAFVSLFVGMHLGMLLTMRLGVFPLASIAALLPFLPPWAWDRLVGRPRNPVARAVRRFGGDGAVERLRGRETSDSGTLATVRRRAARVVPAVVAVSLAVMLLWNAAGVGLVGIPGTDAEPGPADHTWSMFAPNPPTTDGWHVAPATLESGDRVDAFHLAPPRGDERPETSEMYPSARWRKYLVGTYRIGNDAFQRAFADYLCQRWNAGRDEAMTDVTVYYVEQPTRLDGPEPTDRIEVVHRSCSAG